MRSSVLPLLSVALLAACEVGPDYQRPTVDTPDSFKESGDWQRAEPGDTINRGAWWSIYNDPTLNQLERQIDISNQNLKAAEAAYRAAVATVDQSRATLFPTVSLDGGATRSGNGKTGSSQPTLYNLSANASWTADVWGNIRRTIESNEANAVASAADIANARLSAQATLATDYFDVRMQDELKRLLDRTVEADRKILTITNNQYQVGTAAKADVMAAETQLRTVEAQAINADVTRHQFEHAIAVLTGAAPSGFDLPADNKLSYRVPNIPAEIPSTLLERRPDIAASERAVMAANAEIGVAESAWFPSLTLNGSFGYSSVALGKLIQASTSFWSFGPSIAETIFDAGARQAAVDNAGAVYDESVANYRQTVLSAFQQVEDNLSSLRILAEQAKAEDEAVRDARTSEHLTLNQYKEGIVPFNNVLIATTTRLSNEQATLAIQRTRLESSVALIQALGGGWDNSQLPKP